MVRPFYRNPPFAPVGRVTAVNDGPPNHHHTPIVNPLWDVCIPNMTTDLTSLAQLDNAVRALAMAKNLDEVKQIHDLAQAAATYARAAKMGLEAQNYAAEIKLRAERKAGEMLAQLERGQGERTDLTLSNIGRSSDYAEALHAADVTRQDAHRWQIVASMPEEDMESYIADTKERGKELTTTGALKLAKALERGKSYQPKEYPPNEALNGHRYRLLCGDFRQKCDEIPDESIDVIITDPPYPREFLPLYGDLGAVAKRVLMPGGSLLVMIGQSYLPDVINLLTPHLAYHWTAAYLTPGGQAVQLWQRKVNTFWKPLLWFVNGEYNGAWIGDVTRSAVNDNDKRFHWWGQSESGMTDIIQRFTEPEQTILDPFCGAGTTGIAALLLGRRFIGIDSDKQHIEIARQRLFSVSVA